MKNKGIVLAGGRSSRFGSNKAIHEFQGRSMLKHSIDLLKDFCEDLLISGDKEEYSVYGYPCIPDKYGEIGPMGGLASCLEEYLKAPDESCIIVISCDMPLVTNDMIARLKMNHQPGKITVFKNARGQLYPFPFLIEPYQLPEIKRLIREGHHELKKMFDACGENDVILKPEEESCMANVNTQEDLSVVEHVYEQMHAAAEKK